MGVCVTDFNLLFDERWLPLPGHHELFRHIVEHKFGLLGPDPDHRSASEARGFVTLQLHSKDNHILLQHFYLFVKYIQLE